MTNIGFGREVSGRLVAARAFLLTTALSAAAALPSWSDSKESFLAIQRQVETIQPRLVNATVHLFTGSGSGSGVIVSKEGHVLTAAHVIAGRGAANGVRVTLQDGRTFRGTILGQDKDTDLGIVKIEGEDLPVAPIGDSAVLNRGQWILATGHPLGRKDGRPPVLRIGRVSPSWRRGSVGEPARIVTDAPLISGDSGGPLFDLSGRVVGINSMITTGERRMASIHVPVNLAKAALAAAKQGESIESWAGPPPSFSESMRAARAALSNTDWAAAARFAKRAAEVDPESAAARVLLARAHSRGGEHALAVSALREACDRGYNDVAALKDDPDFVALGRQPAMARLITDQETFNGVPGQNRTDRTFLSTISTQVARNHTVGVVRLTSEGREVALGTIMSTDGDILTKASELPEGPLTAVLPDGRTVTAERGAVDTGWDLALIRVKTPGLRTLPFAEGSAMGRWTFSPDSTGGVAAVGVVGVAQMPVKNKGIQPASKAFMGVGPAPTDPEVLTKLGLSSGVAVNVTEDMPAAKAGVRTGDIFVDLDGVPLKDWDTLMEYMGKKRPGETLKVRVARGEERLNLNIQLTARPEELRNPAEKLSGEVSRMQGPFPRVMHHDALLRPSAMGGPVLDADGRLIGLNIARADRTSTYAIEAKDLREIYTKLRAAK
jgi:serine protease Do